MTADGVLTAPSQSSSSSVYFPLLENYSLAGFLGSGSFGAVHRYSRSKTTTEEAEEEEKEVERRTRRLPKEVAVKTWHPLEGRWVARVGAGPIDAFTAPKANMLLSLLLLGLEHHMML